MRFLDSKRGNNGDSEVNWDDLAREGRGETDEDFPF